LYPSGAGVRSGFGWLTGQDPLAPNRSIYDINIIPIRFNGCSDGLDALPFLQNEC